MKPLLVVLVLAAVVSVDVITWVVIVGPFTGHVDMQLVLLVLPSFVSVDVITWVVSVGPSTVQVYMQTHQTSHPHTYTTYYLL